MRIRLTVADTVLTATMINGPTTRGFLAMLPLTLTLSDFNSTEKIADLPARLSTAGAPAGIDPEVGDIAYYAPWGNLAIFYRGFTYSQGLIKLGALDGDISVFAAQRRPFEITIEQAAG